MRVTMYLLRPQAELRRDILRRSAEFRELPLRDPPSDNMAWRLFVHPGEDKVARWHTHLEPILRDHDDEAPPQGRSPGAVLLVEAHGRIFAVTFGTGFHAVDEGLREPDFGLKVAANSMDPNQVTLADARGLGKGRRNATSRLPTPNEVFALGLFTDEEWVRKFGGRVKIEGFAKSVNGADSLQLTIEEFRLLELPDKLRHILELYESDDYLGAFPFLNYFRRESDRGTISALDQLIAEQLHMRNPDIGFAMPDEFNLAPDRYTLSAGRKAVTLTELLTEDVYRAIDEIGGWSRTLDRVKVEAYDLSDQLVSDRVPLRDYVVGSVRVPKGDGIRDYAMTAGAWFRIDQEYVDLVDRYIADGVVDLTAELSLPAWDDDFLVQNVEGLYGEDRYNRWVASERGFALLDRDFYRGRPGQQVEICDILTPDKKLICVKRMDGSDKMSHLFQQGSVSAQMIMADDDYQAQLMTRLRLLDEAATFGTAPEWTVVYAIATSKPGDLKEIMYFFSRAALKMHGESIKSRGFKVAIAKIKHGANR